MNRYEIKLRELKDGTITWECCVQAGGKSFQSALDESDKLVAELKKRYELSGPQTANNTRVKDKEQSPHWSAAYIKVNKAK